MINNSYKHTYTNLFAKFLREGKDDFYAGSALPSYTHNNKLMSWLFWKRVGVALSMAGNVNNQAILDFGCGSGVTFKYLNERGCRITGCDCAYYEMVQLVCQSLNINARIYSDLFEIKDTKFDCILALDVLEHIEDIDLYIEKLIELGHDKTKIIISGPTETLLYKAGRWLAGFSGDYHCRSIYDIEKSLRKKNLERITLKKLYFPFTLFRISSWMTQQKER